MGAWAIFICHECKLATREANEEIPWTSFNHGPSMQVSIEEFSKAHEGHDVEAVSDAHGQVTPEEYNFETRQFEIEY